MLFFFKNIFLCFVFKFPLSLKVDAYCFITFYTGFNIDLHSKHTDVNWMLFDFYITQNVILYPLFQYIK
jgi:hypothetical protein